MLGLVVQIVRKRPGQSTFEPLPRRWLVERTLAWISKHRRYVCDYERLPAHHEAMVTWAMVAVMTRRLARPHQPSSIQANVSEPHALTPALRLGWLVAPSKLVEPLAREKHDDDMGSSLLEQHALARFVASGGFARHLRRIRPIYRDRRDATISALEALLPRAGWQGEAAGLHLYVTLPTAVDVHAVAAAAYERNVLVELGSWHWASREHAPPSLVLGYGGVTEARIRRGLRVIAQAVDERARARNWSV